MSRRYYETHNILRMKSLSVNEKRQALSHIK